MEHLLCEKGVGGKPMCVEWKYYLKTTVLYSELTYLLNPF